MDFNDFKDYIDIDNIFVSACEKGDKKVIEMMLKNGIDANIIDNYGNTGLLVACKNNNEEIIEMLLKNGADINVRDCNGNTGLLIACIYNHNKIVEMLLKNGADKEIKNNFDHTPLMLATRAGYTEIVKMLEKKEHVLEKDCEVTIENKTIKEITKIISFVTENKDNKTALNSFFDIYCVDKEMQLINSAERGNLEAVKVFLDNGADIFSPSYTTLDRTKTIYEYLIENCNEEIVKYIKDKYEKKEQKKIVLEKDCEVTIKNDSGKTKVIIITE